jgi:Uma2 family endonuclease
VQSLPRVVSVEEYLRTSFTDGDREYIDGRIVERNLGEKDHSKTLAELIYFFGTKRDSLGTIVFPSQRVQVKPRRVRVPDLCVYLGKEPEDQVFHTPPFLAIEILSKDDRPGEVQEKIRDYLEFGVPYVWVIDPRKRTGFIYTPGGEHEARDGVLRTANPEIILDLRQVL